MASSSDSNSKDMLDVFRMFDVNNDGHITATEVGQLLRAFGHNPSEDELKDIIHNLDVDENGTIEQEELIAMMEDRFATKSRWEEIKELRSAFELFDADGNGFIDRQEIKTALKVLGEDLTEEEIQDILEEADLNKDGRLDFFEFCRVIRGPIFCCGPGFEEYRK